MGLDPGTPGSRPGPKAAAKPLSHTGIPQHVQFRSCLRDPYHKCSPKKMVFLDTYKNKKKMVPLQVCLCHSREPGCTSQQRMDRVVGVISPFLPYSSEEWLSRGTSTTFRGQTAQEHHGRCGLSGPHASVTGSSTTSHSNPGCWLLTCQLLILTS